MSDSIIPQLSDYNILLVEITMRGKLDKGCLGDAGCPKKVLVVMKCSIKNNVVK